MVRVALCVAVLASVGAPAAAQDPPQVPKPAVALPGQQAEVQQVKDELERLRAEFDALRRSYDERLLALETRLSQIGGGPMILPPATVPAAPAVEPAPVPDEPPASQGAPVSSGKVFNPDMSVNGNFVGAAGRNPFATLAPLQLSEVEAAFQAVVDPYARADFYLSLGTEGIEVEEGFITFTSLPANLLLKVGKLRAQFGKMNTLHTHSLPSVDRSLVTENLVGGDEGLSDAGLSLSRLINNPYVFLEVIGEVYRGENEVFQSVRRSSLAYVGRARAYKDLTDSANIDVGASVAFGPAIVDVPPPILTPANGGSATLQVAGLDKRLVGIDATFRYRPLERAIYRRLNIRTEFIWSRQEMPTGPEQRAFGLYASAEYQFARRWYVGGRVDRSGRVDDAAAVDKGGAVFLTFWPTEFSQIRGQFRRVRFAEGVRANEFLFQFNFSIGAHGAHVF